MYHSEKIDGLTVKYLHDTDAGMPWENCDGHGPVRQSGDAHYKGYSDKKPGERPLNDGGNRVNQYYYDWKQAIKIARRDGWNTEPFNAPNPALRAVQQDFDFLAGFLRQDWQYVGIVIEDADGNTLDSLWGVETYKNYHEEQAREMVEACLDAKREAWRKALHEARERKYWASRDVETVGA